MCPLYTHVGVCLCASTCILVSVRLSMLLCRVAHTHISTHTHTHTHTGGHADIKSGRSGSLVMSPTEDGSERGHGRAASRQVDR